MPLLGSVPFLKEGSHLAVDTFRKKYGDIYTIGLFCKEIVVLTNWELIRDVFGRAEFSGRADIALARQVSFGNYGTASVL